jgi:hypothetical protein
MPLFSLADLSAEPIISGRRSWGMGLINIPYKGRVELLSWFEINLSLLFLLFLPIITLAPSQNLENMGLNFTFERKMSKIGTFSNNSLN